MDRTQALTLDLLQASALILIKRSGKPYDLGSFAKAYETIARTYFDADYTDIWEAAELIKEKTLAGGVA